MKPFWRVDLLLQINGGEVFLEGLVAEAPLARALLGQDADVFAQFVQEAREAVKWAYFPPKGDRSAGAMTRAYRDVPGGYRNTINKNLVLIAMIETLDGLKDADKIAALPGIDGLFAASSDLGFPHSSGIPLAGLLCAPHKRLGKDHAGR